MKIKNLENFWEIDNQSAFESLAIDTFYYQYKSNEVYRSFCDLINCSEAEVDDVKKNSPSAHFIFKSKKVCSFQAKNPPFSVLVPLQRIHPLNIISANWKIITPASEMDLNIFLDQ